MFYRRFNLIAALVIVTLGLTSTPTAAEGPDLSVSIEAFDMECMGLPMIDRPFEFLAFRQEDQEMYARSISGVEPNQRIQLYYTISNLGNSTSMNTLVDIELPKESTSVIISGGSCTESADGQWQCSIGNILPSADAVIIAELTLPWNLWAPGLVSLAVASPTTCKDARSSNNYGLLISPCPSCASPPSQLNAADLNVDGSAVLSSGRITYNLTIENVGTEVAYLGHGLFDFSDKAENPAPPTGAGTCTSSDLGGVVEWDCDFGNLQAGQHRTITGMYDVGSGEANFIVIARHLLSERSPFNLGNWFFRMGSDILFFGDFEEGDTSDWSFVIP